jgi:soluble lytic murein transglycosylase-like protein
MAWAAAALCTAALPALAAPCGTTQSPIIRHAVHRLAPGYGLDPVLVDAIVHVESGQNPAAVSPKDAVGLMQLTAATALRFGVRDRLDPVQNLQGGMSYLRELAGRYGGNLELTLAAYNAGEGAVARYGGVPPYAETQDYVARVRRCYTGGPALPATPAAARARLRPLPIVLRPAEPKMSARADEPPRREMTRSGVLVLRGRGPT